MTHVTDNERFKALRERLRERGFELRINWDTTRGITHSSHRHTDVAHFTVHGSRGITHSSRRHTDVAHFTVHGSSRPAIATLIVIDYHDGNGLGVYFESPNTTITDDVEQIIGEVTS